MTVAPQKKHICLIAYSCTPGSGSEEGVGWGWTHGLSKYVDICLITRQNNVPAIDNEIRLKGLSNIIVIGVDLPVWMRFWKRGPRGAMLYHYFWQRLASKTAIELNKKRAFDLFHHLNFAVSWQPCWVSSAGRTVYGPLDGVGIISPFFWTALGVKNTAKEILRALVVWFGESLDPFVRITHGRCNAIVYRTKFMASRLKGPKAAEMNIIPDTGLDEESIGYLSRLSEKRTPSDKIRIIFMGRLIGRKGVPLALTAFARAQEKIKAIELVLIGDGPEKQKLLDLCNHLGIQASVQFTGRLDRKKAWEVMAGGEIFLYPSLRDAVATVVLEAMGVGLPIICLAGTGPAQVIDSKTGVVIKPGTVHRTVGAIAEAIILLAENPLLRQKMGETAQKIVAEKHSWDARARAMLKIYSDSLTDTDGN